MIDQSQNLEHENSLFKLKTNFILKKLSTKILINDLRKYEMYNFHIYGSLFAFALPYLV